jgi:TP901 family phage tail tape measure protein
MVVRELISRWGFDVDMATLENMEQKLEEVRNQWLKVGAVATAALVGMVKPASDLDAAVRQALTAAGGTVEQLESMHGGLVDEAKQMARELGVQGTQIAEGFYNTLSTGAQVGTEGFRELTKTAIKLGDVVGMQTAQSIEVLSDATNAFGGDLANVNKLANQFFKTSNLSTVNVTQLSEAFKEAGPTAKNLNTSVGETMAILGVWASKGLKGAQAGTAFQMVFNRLTNSAGPAAKELERIGVKAFDSSGRLLPLVDILQQLKEKTSSMTDEQRIATLSLVAGNDAYSKLSSLLQADLGLLGSWSEQINNAGNDMDNAFDFKRKGFGRQFSELIQSVFGLAEALGRPLLKPMGVLVRVVTRITQFFEEMAEKSELFGWLAGSIAATVAAVSLFVAAMAGIGLVVIPAIMTIKKLMGTFAMFRAQMGVIQFLTGKTFKTIAAQSISGALLAALPWVAFAAVMFLIIDDIVGMFTGKKTFFGDIVGDWFWDNITNPLLNALDLLEKKMMESTLGKMLLMGFKLTGSLAMNGATKTATNFIGTALKVRQNQRARSAVEAAMAAEQSGATPPAGPVVNPGIGGAPGTYQDELFQFSPRLATPVPLPGQYQTNNITVNVPPGTPQEQVEFFEQNIGAALQDAWDAQMRKAKAAVPGTQEVE